MPQQFLIAAVLGVCVAAFSYRFRILTLSGSIAAMGLAVIIFGFGSWQWGIPIVTFFVTSSLLSNVGSDRKRHFKETFEKSGARDWGQVAANGGVAGVLALAAGLFPAYDLYPLYLSALAAVTADTWGTELGVLSKGKVVSILNFRPVQPGTSGGVSEFGTIGGILGAGAIALSGYFWYADSATAVLIVLGGAVGSLADSIIGATAQAKYQCDICARETERRNHCDTPSFLVGGFRWINNDLVNFFCAVAGAVAGWGMMLLLGA